MTFDHPSIKQLYVIEVGSGRFKPVKTLVVQTDLAMPGIGEACRDARLAEVLEFLDVIKEEARKRFGDFEAVDIRGVEEDTEPARFNPALAQGSALTFQITQH